MNTDIRQRCCRMLANGDVDWRLLTDADYWDRVLDEGVGACIWQAVLSAKDGCQGDVLPQVKVYLRAQAANFLLMRKLSASVLSALGQADVPCLMLRGLSLSETLYQPSSSRPQIDIDVLVPDDMGEAAGAALMQGGWQPVQAHPLLFIRNEILLDVHVEPLGIGRIRAWAHLTPLRTPDFFTHASPGVLAGVHTPLVHPRVNLPYLCFHAMKHSFNRLIWLWDIALMTRRIEEHGQWAEVMEGMRSYRLERSVYYALSYARQHLGASVPENLLETIAPAMDWRERRMFSCFMRHEQIPFLAERVFARMQPDFLHRLMFWQETILPRKEVRRQINDDDLEVSGFLYKRISQITVALRSLWRLGS